MKLSTTIYNNLQGRTDKRSVILMSFAAQHSAITDDEHDGEQQHDVNGMRMSLPFGQYSWHQQCHSLNVMQARA
jgi:hypothetical protein